MPKALFIIASEGFQDWEYNEPKTILESAGFDIKVASTKVWKCYPYLWKIDANSDMILQDVEVDDYDVVVFVWWPWVPNDVWADDAYINIFKDAYQKWKIVGAICIAPVILSNSWLFEWKKVTCFDWWKGEQIEQVKSNWWHFTGNDVEVEWNLITANWPNAASDFWFKILQVYRQNEL